MDRSQRLYDCITQIGDHYLEEALKTEIRKSPPHFISRGWLAVAASLILVAGIGVMLPQMGIMGGSKSESSAPAASAPAAAEPESADLEFQKSSAEESQTGGSGRVSHLEVGQYVVYPDGTCGILTSMEASPDLEKGILDAVLSDKAMIWLEYRDGMYRVTGEPTEIILYDYTEEVDLISDGEQTLLVVKV